MDPSIPNPSPLQGCRVLDLTRLLPGPACTWLLARMGADVIKVEAPGAGDYLRHIEGSGVSASYRLLNEGKKHIVLNLKHENGHKVLRRLLENTDILVEQFRPGVLERLGVPIPELRQQFPRLIIASITGYGQTGPYRNRAGHDLNFMALSGLLAQEFAPERSSSHPAFQAADMSGGTYYAAVCILGALLKASQTGEGAHLDISMTEGVLPLGFSGLGNAFSNSEGPQRYILQGSMPGYGVYRCKDDTYLAVAAMEPKFWVGFCQALGKPDWVGKRANLEGWPEFETELADLLATQPRSKWLKDLEPYDCCVEPVLTPAETIEHPQHTTRGVFVDGPACRLPALEALRGPSEDSPTDFEAGSSTREVLLQTGFSAEEIDALIDNQVVSTS